MSVTRTVLIIDDDPDFCEFAEIVLGSAGFGVHSRSSVEQGLALVRECVPDLVIADVMLSYRLDGWNILTEMRALASCAYVPVLMVSAVASIDEGIPLDDCSRFLRKPLSPSQLLESAHSMMAEHKETEP